MFETLEKRGMLSPIMFGSLPMPDAPIPKPETLPIAIDMGRELLPPIEPTPIFPVIDLRFELDVDMIKGPEEEMIAIPVIVDPTYDPLPTNPFAGGGGNSKP
jgi:hypothetical protein